MIPGLRFVKQKPAEEKVAHSTEKKWDDELVPMKSLVAIVTKDTETEHVQRIFANLNAANVQPIDSAKERLMRSAFDAGSRTQVELVELQLKDPVTLTRLHVPARGTRCTHYKAFDLLAFCQVYVNIGRRRGTIDKHGAIAWPAARCPICNIEISAVAVDAYLASVLSELDADVESIIIEPSGEWKVGERASPEPSDLSDESHDDAPAPEVVDLVDSPTATTHDTSGGSRKRKHSPDPSGRQKRTKSTDDVHPAGAVTKEVPVPDDELREEETRLRALLQQQIK